MARLQFLALMNALLLLLLVLTGGLFRLSGAGDVWWPAAQPGTLTMSIHGIVVAAASVLLLVVALLTKRAADASRRSRLIAWLAVGLLIALHLTEATVAVAWLPVSTLVIAPVLTMGLLGLAGLLYWSLANDHGGPAWPEVRSEPGAAQRDEVLVRLTRFGVVALLIVIATGSVTGGGSSSLPCPSWPLCVHDGVVPDQPTAAVWLQVAHRAVTAIAAFVLFAAAARVWTRPTSSAVRRLSLIVAAVLVVQILLGGNLVVAGGPVWLGLLHLTASVILWLAVLALALAAPRALKRRGQTRAIASATSSANGTLPLAMPLAATGHPTATMALEATAPLDVRLPDIQAIRATIADYVALTKPGILTLLLVTTFAAMLIAASGLPPFGLICITILGGILAAGGANVLNCYIDRDIDAEMTRTRHRATASNRIPLPRVLAFGLGLSGLSVLLLGVGANWVAALLALAGNLFYVLVYTKWLKRRTPQNIVIGGAAGAVPPLVGWAAVTGGLSPIALMLFAIIFMWTPPHFWALALLKQGEYGRAAVPMLPVVAGEAATRRQIVAYSALLFLVCLALVPMGLGPIYLVAAVAINAVFLGMALLLYWRPAKRHARQLFFWSLWYLALIFLAAVADRLILS